MWTWLTRFVYRDNDAYAVYYAGFTDSHPNRVAVAVSLGEWTEEAGPQDRVAFALELWSTATEYQVGLVEPCNSPWRDVAFLGRMLSRAEALEHPWLSDVFHLTDHMISDDPELRGHLAGPQSTG